MERSLPCTKLAALLPTQRGVVKERLLKLRHKIVTEFTFIKLPAHLLT